MGYPYSLSLDGRRGGQASSEDLFPLGYGEWERIKVRVGYGYLFKDVGTYYFKKISKLIRYSLVQGLEGA